MSDNETLALPPEPPLALPPSPRRTPWVAIALISVAVLGLAAVGYIAWQQGYLDNLVAPKPQSPVKVIAQPAAPAEGAAATESDPLDKLQQNVAGIHPYRRFADVLRGMDAELDDTKVETQTPGKLAESTRQRLYDLQKLGTQFVADYDDFERRAARDTQPKLQPFQEVIRTGFLERMKRFIEIVGEAYAAEQGVNHPVFTMSDTFIAAVQKYGRADSTPLRDAWLAAVHAQEQSKLSAEYEPQLKELQARIEKLKQTHREVDRLLKAAPEYHIRGGVLGATARNLLEMYESLSSRVEGDVVDFEQYTQTIPEENGSDDVAAKVAEFNKLAQDDHFYAFHETYKIYEQDRDLEHPAYQRLKDHFKFAEEHWPKLKGQYQDAYTTSEGIWARNFAK